MIKFIFVFYPFKHSKVNILELFKVIKAVEECQMEILKKNPDISKAAIKIPTLHITLFAMHLKDANQIEM